MVVSCWLVVGCGGDDRDAPPDAEVAVDGGPARDAGRDGDDGGIVDAGSEHDAAGADAGRSDAGPPPLRALVVPERAHRPHRASAAGTRTVSREGEVVRFRFEGADGRAPVEYRVDLAHPDVRAGLVRVTEAESDAIALSEGGLSWRTASGVVLTPRALATASPSVLVSSVVDADAGTLTLTYDDAYEGVVARKLYVFALEGGALRVRLRSDARVRRAWTRDYGGVMSGPARNLARVRRVEVPYAGSVPLVRFETPAGAGRFLATFVDWYRSSAADLGIEPLDPAARGVGADGTSFHLFFSPVPEQGSDGVVLAPIDETLYVVVTERVVDALPQPAHTPSPYRRTLAARLMLLFGDQSPGAFGGISNVVEWLEQSGVDGLAGIFFAWQRYGLNLLDPTVSPPGVMGCDGADLFAHSTPLDPPLTFAIPGVGTHTARRVVDPEDPAIRACGRARLGAVTARLAARGHLFSLYQDGGNIDPHGHDGLAYPTDVPLAMLAFGTYALRLPSFNPGYTPARADEVVRAADGTPMPSWDTTQNLAATSWAGAGYSIYPISPTHRTSYYIDGLAEELAPGGLGPRAVYIDAADAEVPSWNQVDRVVGSPRAHTIAAAIAAQQSALDAVRRRVGGPLFGEGAYAKRAQWESFESGLWDGRSRHMTPPDELGARIEQTLGQPIIPDYELFSILPRASGHYGMGWESLFGRLGVDYGFPVDLCIGGGTDCDRSSIFLDPWFAHEVTFGHMAYAGLNGWTPNEYRTLEGLLREWALVGAVHGAVVATEVASIVYVDAAGTERSLEQALAVDDFDFVHPRVRIRYASGLEVYVNHGLATRPWSVSLPPEAGRGFDTVALPRHGFLAFDPEGLLVFSALNPDPAAPAPTQRVEFARVPGRYTMVNGRGVVQAVAGFPDAETRAALAANPALLAHTVIRNDVRRIVVAADRGLGTRGDGVTTGTVGDALTLLSGSGSWVVQPIGAPPALASIVIDADVDLLPAGQQTGVRAIGRYDNDAWADFTTRVTWITSDPAVLRVDAAGGVSAERRGTATVTARFAPDGGGVAIASAPITLQVTAAP